MSAKTTKRLEAAGFIGLVLLIIWLLLQKSPVNIASATPATINNGGVTVNGGGGTAAQPLTINENGGGYSGGTINVGGPDSLPAITLQLLYPQYNVPASSCDCGCSSSDPLNAASQVLSTFITQYQDGVVTDLNQAQSAATSGLPAWLSQYISDGGGAFGGASATNLATAAPTLAGTSIRNNQDPTSIEGSGSFYGLSPTIIPS